MSAPRMKATGNRLMTVGGALLGYAALRDLIYDLWGLDVPQPVFAVALGTGFVCLLAGGGIWSVAGRARRRPRWLRRPGTRSVIPRPARPEEMDDVRALALKLIGPPIASAELLRSWLRKNPNVFFVAERPAPRRTRRRQGTLIGYYSVRPITEEARDKIERGLLHGGSLQAEHIVEPGGRAAAAYVGGVVLDASRRERQEIVMAVKAEISRMRVRHVYTNPSTDEGEQLAINEGFEPLSELNGIDSEVWRLDLDGGDLDDAVPLAERFRRRRRRVVRAGRRPRRRRS